MNSYFLIFIIYTLSSLLFNVFMSLQIVSEKPFEDDSIKVLFYKLFRLRREALIILWNAISLFLGVRTECKKLIEIII